MVSTPPVAGSVPGTDGFVGREGELAALGEALTHRPALAVVEGEAGIGKTRLVTELQNEPAVPGRFVVGSCHRIREPFPLGPILEAVRDVRDELSPGRLSPVAGVLRPLLPELAPVLPPEPEPLGDRAAQRHRVFRALVEVLGSLGEVVLVLEDLHWADEQTTDFLRYLLGSWPPKLCVLETFRGDEVDPSVRALTAKLPAPVTHTHLVLSPLDARQTGALGAAILGLDRVSEEFARYLCERASGLPFVIEELLALMQARGVLIRRDGGWARKAIDELDVPAGVRDPVLERFGRSGEDARAVAEAAAVLQTPASESVLLGTSRLPAARALKAVEIAVESGLLTEQPDGGLGFRHILAAQAIYEALPGPRRRDLHARAATALAAQDPVLLGQRAHHLRHAGLQREWVEAALEAADRAAALGHDDEATRLLEDVLRDAPLDAEQRGRVAVRLGRAAQQVLHVGDDVVSLLTDALEQDLPRSVRGELRLRLGTLLERAGADFRTHRALLAEAVPDLGDQPALLAHAMAGLGIPAPGVPLAEHRQWLQQVLETVPRVDDQALRVSLLGKVAMVQVAVGDPQWRESAERILAQTGGAPRQPAEVSAFHSVGANACYAGHLPLAERLLSAAAAASKESKWRELSTRATIALLDYLRGAWDGLVERADTLADRLAGFAPGRADVEVVAGCLALARGDLGTANAHIEEVVQRLTEQGAFDVLPFVVGAMIRQTLGRGDVADAAAHARRFIATMDSVPFVVSAAWALPAVSEALVAAGERDEAQAVVTQWERQLRGLDAPVAGATLPHARGVLTAASGSWSAAADQLREAAEQYETLGCPYETARAREQAAAALFHRDGDAGGRDEHPGAVELRASLAAFQRLGASWDLDRMSGLARQHGIPVPARHRRGPKGYGTDLSPRERAVAQLAAAGHTNQEIADELFVSVNTVKKQLAAAMRKLGVGSRSAVYHRLTK